MATQQLTATLNYRDGTTTDVTSSATWTSDDEAVATVDAAGLITGVATGSCTVTGTYDGFTDTCAVTVA